MPWGLRETNAAKHSTAAEGCWSERSRGRTYEGKPHYRSSLSRPKVGRQTRRDLLERRNEEPVQGPAGRLQAANHSPRQFPECAPWQLALKLSVRRGGSRFTSAPAPEPVSCQICLQLFQIKVWLQRRGKPRQAQELHPPNSLALPRFAGKSGNRLRRT